MPERHPEYHAQLDHLVALAQHPGWKAYVWARAKELDAQPMFAGLAEALKQAMTKTP